ncbi:MAG TPA: glycosyltransferase family 39 protein [Candidatus Deferrimicrobiaceae bacterium]
MCDPSEGIPGPSHSRRSSRRHLPAVAVLAVAVLAVFGSAVRNGFVWDDVFFILRNPFLHDLANLPKFFISGDAAGTGTLNPYYRPLTTTTFALDFALWGRQPAGYHATNILLHLATTIALYFAARRTTRHEAASLSAALLFAVHPAHAEPVGYISARADLLCAFFMLTAFLAYARFDVSGKRGHLILSSALFTLGALSKIVALILIPLLLVHIALFRRGKARWMPALPFLAIGLAFLAARSWVLKMESWGNDPLAARMADAGIHMAIYLKNTFLPVGLKVFYALPPSRSLPDPLAVVPWLVLLPAAVAGAYLVRGRPSACIGGAWYLLALVPVCGLFMKLYPTGIADRYLYIPLAGMAILVAGLLRELSAPHRFPLGRAAIRAIVVACALACSIQTAGRLNIWRDSLSFWRTAASEAPRSPYALAAYGSSLRVAGRFPEAEATLKAAIALDDRFAHPHIQLTLLEFSRGNLVEAERHTLRALQLEPASPVALMHLALIKAEKGWTGEAVLLLREAIRLNPYYTDARINLDTLLNRTRGGQG